MPLFSLNVFVTEPFRKVTTRSTIGPSSILSSNYLFSCKNIRFQTNGKEEIVWCIALYKIKNEGKKENEREKVECDLVGFIEICISIKCSRLFRC